MRRIYTRTGDKGETGLFAGSRVPKDHPRIDAIGVVDELNAVVGLVRAQLSSRAKSRDLPDMRMLRTDSTGSLDALLRDLQNLLFTIGADLATVADLRRTNADSRGLEGEGPPKVPCLTQLHLTRLESAVDALTAPLPELTTFVLPAGGMLTAHLHLARTVTRRAERAVVVLAHGALNYETHSHVIARSQATKQSHNDCGIAAPLRGSQRHEGEGFRNSQHGEPLNPLILPFLNRLSTLFFVLARTSSLTVDGEEEKWEK